MEPFLPGEPTRTRPVVIRRGPWIDLPVGTILGRSLRIFTARSLVLIPLAAVCYAAPTWLQVRNAESMYDLWRRSDRAVAWGRVFRGWDEVPIFLTDWLLPLAFQAVVAYAVFRSLRGDSPRWTASIGHGLRRLPHAVGASVCIFLAMVLPPLGLLYVTLRLMSEAVVMNTAVVLLLVLFVLLPYVVHVAARFNVGVQVAVVEGTGPLRALRRSSFLTHGVRLRLVAVLSVVVLLPYVLGHAARGVFLTHAVDEADYAARFFLQRGFEVVFAPLQAVAAAVTYHALREAKEGVGLDDLLAVFD